VPGQSGIAVTLEEIDVLGHRVAGDAQLLAYPPLAHTRGVELEYPFYFSHVYLLVRHGPFSQKKTFGTL